MIRSPATLVLLGLSLAAPACEPSEPQVAFLLSTLQEERYQKDVKHFEARAHELGLSTITLAADNDSARQLAQVEAVLARGAKVLVIQPTDSTAASSYVRLAHEQGAKVIAYDRAIISPDLDYYVTHDSYRVGVLQAEAALAATAGKGAYVLLAGEAGHSVANEIMRGYENTLAPYVARGDVQIVLAQHHSGWSAEQARRTVEAALTRTGGELDAILANNSGLARGAVQAVTAAAARVFIAGADADAANVNLVCQGTQTIEVLKDIQPLAKSAAEVAKRLYDRESPKRGSATIELGGRDVPVEAVKVGVVTSSTVKTMLVDTGLLSAHQLPACKSQLASK